MSTGLLDDVGGVPVLAGAYRTEGELADGLTVPSGTALLGDVLPDPAVYASGPTGGLVPGWRAFLLVVGEVSQVLEDLEGQVADLGLQRLQDELVVPECVVASYQPPDGIVECRRAWQNTTVWLDADIWRGEVAAGYGTATSRPVSLLTIQLGRLSSAAASTTEPPTGSVAPPATGAAATTSTVPAPTTTVASPAPGVGPTTTTVDPPAPRSWSTPPTTTPDQPLPGDWPEPPGPGQRLGDGITPPDDLVVSLLLSGDAQAVVAPWPTGGNAPNYAAILAVTGDLDTVMTDFVGQITERFDPSEVQDQTKMVDGNPVRTVRGDQAGGSKIDLVAVTVNGRTWVTVSTGYD